MLHFTVEQISRFIVDNDPILCGYLRVRDLFSLRYRLYVIFVEQLRILIFFVCRFALNWFLQGINIRWKSKCWSLQCRVLGCASLSDTWKLECLVFVAISPAFDNPICPSQKVLITLLDLGLVSERSPMCAIAPIQKNVICWIFIIAALIITR